MSEVALRIERYQSSRQRGFSGCSCGLILLSIIVIAGVIGVIIIPALPAIGLRLAGFETIQVNTNQATAEPIPEINNAQNSTQIRLSAGSYGQQTLPASSAYTIKTGTSEDGTTIAQVAIAEGGIATLCSQYTDVCTSTSSTLRNVTVDLQTGRAIIQGEAFVSALNTWQSLSVIVSLTTDNRIQVDGVNINGTLFSIPDNEIGQRILDIQQTANQALNRLTIQTNGTTYRISDIALTETQLVATFR